MVLPVGVSCEGACFVPLVELLAKSHVVGFSPTWWVMLVLAGLWTMNKVIWWVDNRVWR